MFENAQQDESSGSGKIVGAVIAVVAVLLLVVYFVFLKGQPSATTAENRSANQSTASAGKADAMKDLAITSKPNLHRDQTETMAMWDIQVTNKSKDFAYMNVHYATKYYNAQGGVISQNEGTLNGTVDPNDVHSFASINDGLYPAGTASYTIELKGAEVAQ